MKGSPLATVSALPDALRSGYPRHRGKLVLVGLAMLLAGLVVLAWSITDFRLAVVLIGAALTTVGVGLVTDWLADYVASGLKAWQAGGLGIAGLVGAGVLLWLSDRSHPMVSVLGVVVALFSLAPLSIAVRDVAGRWPVWSMVLGLLFSVLGPGLSLFANVSWAIGAAMLVLGLMAYQAGLRARRDVAFDTDKGGSAELGRAWSKTGSLVAGVLVLPAVVLAFVLVIMDLLDTDIGTDLLTAPCCYLVIVALVTLGVTWPDIGLAPLDPRTVGAFGMVFALLGFILLLRSGLTTEGVLIVLAIVIAGAGAFIVWRGEAVFLVVMLGFVIVWGVVDRTASQSSNPAEIAASPAFGSSEYIVALGDSYMSGEGAPEFFEGTDQDGDENTRNECRRAPTAFAYVVADELGTGLGFFACSGAKMVHINALEGDDPERQASGTDPETDRRMATDQHNEDPQITQLKRFQEGLATDETIVAALVTIGGNEARFGDVGKGCLLPGTCAEQREVWLQNIETFGPDLVRTYETIKAQVAPAPVVVMPYPLLLTEDTCNDSPLDQAEHEFLTEFITVLDEQLRVSAARAGVHFFEQGMFAFEGDRICQTGDAMNLVALQPSDGSFFDRLTPGNWGHNSMHPTPHGHALMADVLAPYLEDLIARGAVNPEPELDARLEVLGIGAVEPLLVDLHDLPPFDDLPEDVRASIDSGSVEFATRVLVRDTDEDGNARAVRVQLTDVDPGCQPPEPVADDNGVVDVSDSECGEFRDPATIYCVTPNGHWVEGKPVVTSAGTEGAGDSEQTAEPTESCEAEVTVGVVTTMRAQPPADVDLEMQWVLYPDRSGSWQLRALKFCSRDDECPDNFDAWQDTQIDRAVETAAPLVLLLVLGGWLFALWFRPDDYLRSFREGSGD